MSVGFPEKYGLYDPSNEKDSCGVGFVAHIKGVAESPDRPGRRPDSAQHGPSRRVRLRAEHG